MQHYFDSLKQCEILTPEQEADLIPKAKGGDKRARDRLVMGSMRLVVKIAREYKGILSMDRLISEGNLGLCRAVDTFDPTKGLRFTTHAASSIRGYMLGKIQREARPVRVATTPEIRRIWHQVQKIKAQLLAGGLDPSPEAIAEVLEATPEDVQAVMDRRRGGDKSMSAPVGENEEQVTTFGDTLAGSDDPEENADRISRHRLVWDSFNAIKSDLDPRECEAIQRVILGEEKLRDVGAGWGVSRQRVHQIKARAEAKLTAAIQARAA